jgi:hypothetical protein
MTLHRETLTNIREFWIALAHKSRFLSDDALATQIETIGRRKANREPRLTAIVERAPGGQYRPPQIHTLEERFLHPA